MKYEKQIYKIIKHAAVILFSSVLILESPQAVLQANAADLGYAAVAEESIELFSGIRDNLYKVLISDPRDYMNIVFNQFKGEPNGDGRIIVSLGDSYSSGEGIEPFYGQYDSDKTENTDWLAHRSVKSWPGQLILDENVMRNVKDNKWFFVASSGAETVDMEGQEGRGQKKEVRRGMSDEIETKYLEPQFAIFDQLDQQNLNADYVTITIGGNDLGFTKVVETCVTGSSFLDHSNLNYLIDEAWLHFYYGDVNTGEAPISEQIKAVYDKIADKAGDQVHVIVAGYPKLFSDDGHILITQTEAQIVNSNVAAFNEKLEKLVEQSDRDNRAKFSFASVIEEFEGHGAFAEDAWINSVMIGPRLEELNIISKASAYSVHPNEQGAIAYARCVQRVIDEAEGVQSIGPAEVVRNLFAAAFRGDHDALIKCIPPDLEDETQVLSAMFGGSEFNQLLGDFVDMAYDMEIIDCYVTEYSEDGSEASVYLKYNLTCTMFGEEMLNATYEETLNTKWYDPVGWRVNIGM